MDGQTDRWMNGQMDSWEFEWAMLSGSSRDSKAFSVSDVHTGSDGAIVELGIGSLQGSGEGVLHPSLVWCV